MQNEFRSFTAFTRRLNRHMKPNTEIVAATMKGLCKFSIDCLELDSGACPTSANPSIDIKFSKEGTSKTCRSIRFVRGLLNTFG